MMQQIKQSTINCVHNTDGGDEKYKMKRKKVQGAWCNFGRVGHIASEAVIVELVNSEYLPTLLYGLEALEACSLKSADLKSSDYIVVGTFMKIFKTKSKEVASCCMEMFNCP